MFLILVSVAHNAKVPIPAHTIDEYRRGVGVEGAAIMHDAEVEDG